ncbi:MAG: hypothetical protein IPK56_09655 [Elusimicrobia bacterium]|nr:hypothetical protein [Elusimicrobiota bacterium]
MDDVASAVDDFFSWEKYWERRDALRDCSDLLLSQKRTFLQALRGEGVFVLEKGAIEDYYPAGITGESKPAKAQHFCNTIKTREQALLLCNSGHMGRGAAVTSEFEAMFQIIFSTQ